VPANFCTRRAGPSCAGDPASRQAQRSRCLDSLLADGLVEQTEDGLFRLPA
jgi:A/G-specific adenine glycosylase